MRKKTPSIFNRLFALFKRVLFPDYYVGYFVVSVSAETTQELIKTLKYCHLEDISSSDLMEMYFNILSNNCNKNSFISSNFFRVEESEAFVTFENLYSQLLSYEGVDVFLPPKLREKGKVYAKEGEVLICTALVTYQTPINKISCKEDLKKITQNFLAKRKDDDCVPVHTVKFQGSSDSETELIALELNMIM